MHIDIEIGRVIGETEAFVDIELEGHDIRNTLAMHASDCFDKLSKEEYDAVQTVITAYCRGDISGHRLNCRVRKNCYAIANSRKDDDKNKMLTFRQYQ